MRSLRIITLLLFPTLLLLTLSCTRAGKDTIKGEVTSIAEGDGGSVARLIISPSP